MNCAEFETVLADYLDDTLSPGERSAIEQHALECAACGEFLRDVTGAVSFLKRAEDVTLPSELVTRIAYQAPMGKSRGPLETQGVLSRLAGKWLQPFLQPRLAMGMAMTILSLAMLERCTGTHVQHIQAADLNPARIWGGVEDKAIRLKDRGVKYYENIRLVYEVETRLKEFENQQEAAPPEQAAPAKNQDTNGGRTAPPEGDKPK